MATNLMLFLICLSTLVTPVWLEDGLHPSIIKILNAFVKLVNFYHENYRDINFDGVFGLRVLEGNLMELVKLHREKKHSSNIPEAIIGQLTTLSNEAANIANLSILYLEKQDRKYFRQMGRIVSQPWTVFKNYRHIDDQYKWGTIDTWPDYGDQIDWYKSDACLRSTLSLDIPDNQKCGISDECLEMFLNRNVHSYRLSQQVFFLMMTEELGCINTVEDYLQQNDHRFVKLADIETDFCTNCYYDIIGIEPDLKHNREFQSLFLVNKFYCGSLGFVEFMKDEWLDIVLGWQKISGCFTGLIVEDNAPEKDKLSRTKEDYLRPDETQPVPQDNVVTQKQNSKRIIRPQKKNIKQNKHIQTNQNSIQAEDNANVQNMNNKNQNNNNNQDTEEKFTDENYANQVSQQRKRREAIINSIEEYKIESTLNRKLLGEREVKGGCLSHKTAMAVGTLTMYLRYLIDPPTQYLIGEGRQKNDYFKPDEVAEQLSASPIEVEPKITVKPKIETSPEAKKSVVSVEYPNELLTSFESPNEELLTGNSLLSYKNSPNTATIVTIIIVVCIIFFFIVIKCARSRPFGSRGKHRY